jgi:hypothetical protein
MLCYTLFISYDSRSPLLISITLFIAGVLVLEFLGSKEELELHAERLEWRKKFLWFTTKSDRCSYSDIDLVEWRKTRFWFSGMRRVDFIRRGSRTLIVAFGCSKGDLDEIHQLMEHAQPALLAKFRYLDQRPRDAMQEF